MLLMPFRLFIILVLAAPLSVYAHKPDTSYFRATISEDAIELRFTYDVITLARFGLRDTNQDGTISRGELEAQAPAIFDYLQRHVLCEVNLRTSDLGQPDPVGWPEDTGDVIEQEDFHQDLIHFPFARNVRDIPEDLYIAFEFFDDVGERHTVMGEFLQGDRQLPVTFDMFEPDYLYDTGYRAPWHRKLLRFGEEGAGRVLTRHPEFVILGMFVVVSAFAVGWKRRRAARSLRHPADETGT